MSSSLHSVTADDGIELQYEAVGSGPPMVMLHGGLAGRGAFSRQRKTLSEHYQLILPSARGNDGTDPTLPADYGFDTSELRDLLTVMDAAGVERTHVVGHSSGGALAFELARRHADRIDRLVLIEPSLIGLLPDDRRQSLIRTLTNFAELGESDGPMACLRASLAAAGGSAWAALDEKTREDKIAPLETMSVITAPHWRALMALDVEPADLADFHGSTLLIYAETGAEFFDFEPLIAECWRRERPDLELITVADAGHNVHRDQPDIVNAAILRFVGDGSAAR